MSSTRQNRVQEIVSVKTRKINNADSPLSADLLQKINAYWRAANYLSVGQIYLYDNPCLKNH